MKIKYIIIFIFILNSAIANNKIDLKFIYEDIEILPWQTGNTKIPEKNPGIYVEAIKNLEKYHKINITLERYPWKRCLIMLENNQADGAFYASYNKKRARIAIYPKINGKLDKDKRLGTHSYHLYKIKGSKPNVKNGRIVDLNGNIMANLGYSINNNLRAQNLFVIEKKLSKDLFFALLNDTNINALAMLSDTADQYMLEHPTQTKNIEKIEEPIKTEDYYLIFSRNFVNIYPELSKNMWHSIQKIRENEMIEIKKKYIENDK